MAVFRKTPTSGIISQMTATSTLELASRLLGWRDMLGAAVWLIGVLIIGVLFLLFVLRKQWRLFKNTAKPIIFINLSGINDGMDVEAKLLRRSGFFSSPEVTNDSRSIDLLDKQSLVVLGISDETDGVQFEAIYRKITTLTKPVIIYTLGARGTAFIQKNEGLIKGYSFHTIATTPLRLMGDIFSILSTFPEQD